MRGETMPNIITHYLFVESVKQEINDSATLSAIKEYPNEYIIGSNGPDFFFFYHFFSQKHEDVRFRSYGNVLHSSHVNDFYQMAIDAMKAESDPDVKEAMRSYIAGHLCHWALDSTTHPYIFYRTGNYTGNSASMHHRFESMLDTMMLKKLLDTDIRKFHFPSLTRPGLISDRVIANVYRPIIKAVFNNDITQQDIKDALADWEKLQRWLYDPKGWKTRVVKQYEKLKQQPWLYSGNIVPAKLDSRYDVLNEQHRLWKYPAEPSRESTESFMDLFEKAKKLAGKVIQAMDNVNECLLILDDRTYDSGVKPGIAMTAFDLIYEEEA